MKWPSGFPFAPSGRRAGPAPGPDVFVQRAFQQFEFNVQFVEIRVLQVRRIAGERRVEPVDQRAGRVEAFSVRRRASFQLNLAGDQGTTLGHDSIVAVRQIVERAPPPPGVGVYVTGPAALVSDMQHAGDSSMLKMTVLGGAIIFVVLLFVYRSIITVIALLLTVGIELFAARGVIAFLAEHGHIGLSTFAINMLVALDDGGRHRLRNLLLRSISRGTSDRREPRIGLYTTYRSVAPVVLGSGLTIAGAMSCLIFTRMPIFQTIGVPSAVSMVVAVVIALTLVPAVLSVGGRFGLFDPKRTIGVRRWRRIGTAIVRWPGPILVATLAVSLAGLLALPGYQTSYNDRAYVPKDIPANLGYAAADRHFSQSRMMPDILVVEADRDMRNPEDFMVLNRLAKAVFQVPGISRVQGVTRPEGTPLENTSIPFLISMQNAGQQQSVGFMKGMVDDFRQQADVLGRQIAVMKRLLVLQEQITATTHASIALTKEMAAQINDLRDSVSNFDDFFRPIRNYLYWEPHCENIPICFSLRSIFDALDGIDELSNVMSSEVLPTLDTLDRLTPQLLESVPPTIAIMEAMRSMMLTMHATMSGIFSEMDTSAKNATAMGQAFDAAMNDDSFYLPPEVFQNEDFKHVMDSFLSPDGKAARFIISHRGDPATPEGIARIDQIRTAAEEALKTTPLSHATIYLAGTASTFKDLSEGSKYDLFIAALGAICLIFVIMLLITRSAIGALVIVGTVILSLGASFGLSVLIWQYFLGINLHWMVLPMSVIVLLAVGSDYNLLLVSRMKEEIAAGLNTGIIRAMGSTGKVVTNAGLVFAFTMAALAASDLQIIGQVGTTIALGLLFDTLIVRSLLLPSIAALLGRWFWWPQVVRPRPASQMLRSSGTRSAVRALLGEDRAHGTVTEPLARTHLGGSRTIDQPVG